MRVYALEIVDAMHFCAKRGIGIACRLSVRLSLAVCLSVTLVNCDHIGWNSSKIISPLVRLGRSLFATPTCLVCSQGNTPKIGPKVTHPVDLSVGDIRSQIAAVWLQIAQRSQWRAYRKLPSLFLLVPSMTPYDLPFPKKMGFYMPPTYANCNISATGDPIHCMFGSRVRFSGTADRTALFYGSNKSKIVTTAMLEKFQVAISLQLVVRSTSCFVLGWVFRGRRI